jgi:hypothetical protein
VGLFGSFWHTHAGVFMGAFCENVNARAKKT